MIQRLLSAVAAVAGGSVPPAEPAILAEILSEEPFALRLLPARIDANGMPVLRLVLESANRIPCTVLRKMGDGQRAEVPCELSAFKPRVGVCYATLEPDGVCWFSRGDRPVSAESVRRRLDTWQPVLVLPSEKKAYFGAAAEILLDCLRPELLIATVPPATFALVERHKSPSRSLTPAPVPARSRLDGKGRFVFRTASVVEYRSDGMEPDAARPVTRKVALSADELAVDPRYVQFFDTEGRQVRTASAAQRLVKEATVLVSGDGRKVNPFYLRGVQRGTLVGVLPFELSAAGKSRPAAEPSSGK